jgi:DNA-binding LacI/PurR family transcriptional regulator
VSRVINGGQSVSPAALTKVHQAIEATGYAVNNHARSLASGRAGSIGFLLTEPHHLLFDDPNFAVLVRGAAEALAARDMPLVLMVASTDSERRRILTFLAAGHVDGVLLISPHAGDPLAERLVADGFPAVCCGKPLGLEQAMGYAASDDRHGARTMTQYLLERGYARIAHVAGPADMSGGVERLAGWREAMGAAAQDQLVVEGDYSRESGRRAALELLDRGVEFDAVFAASDLMAAGAMSVLREQGWSVPTDVGVAGFDDGGPAAQLDPPLTTMRQPFDRISAEMVRLLLDAIAGADPAAVLLPTTLVVRDSTR